MECPLLLCSGNANRPLAEAVARRLELPLANALVTTFKDGESRVRIDEDVRGTDAFVIQPTSPPVNHHLMELLVIIDALRRASARQVTAVLPYYGYARQEKKAAGREPISAKLVANLITTAGADRVVTFDLTAPAIEGFFDIPVDHLRATPILADYFRTLNLQNLAVVAPDAGAVKRAEDFRQRVAPDAPLVIVFKHRPRADTAEVQEMVGDVAGRTAILVDDLISTGGTLLVAAEALLERGAESVHACATHGVLAADAAERLTESPLKRIVVTDTIDLPPECRSEKIVVCSVAPLLAETIRRIHEQRSVSELFR